MYYYRVKLILKILGISLLVVLLVFVARDEGLSLQSLKNLASVFFFDSVTTEELQYRYQNNGAINILIVPGHDPVQSGAAYKGTKESDLTVHMGRVLEKKLKSNPQFVTTLARSEDGFHPSLQYAFSNERDLILLYRTIKQNIMRHLINAEVVTPYVGVEHNTAPTETAVKLYGINKWANETKQDIVIHIHFNDYPGRPYNKVGKHSGFSIYIPESQYSNAKASKDFGIHLKKQLETKFSPSSLPLEQGGLIEDQELIAIGSNNSVDGISILVEYGYIYEPQFQNETLRTQTLESLAKLTYEAIEDYLSI